MDKLYGLVLLHSLFLKFNDYNDIIGSMMQIQGEWVTRRTGKTNKPADPGCVHFSNLCKFLHFARHFPCKSQKGLHKKNISNLDSIKMRQNRLRDALQG